MLFCEALPCRHAAANIANLIPDKLKHECDEEKIKAGEHSGNDDVEQCINAGVLTIFIHHAPRPATEKQKSDQLPQKQAKVRRQADDEDYEQPVVPLTDAVVDPDTMVVLHLDTDIAVLAVISAGGFNLQAVVADLTFIMFC